MQYLSRGSNSYHLSRILSHRYSGVQRSQNAYVPPGARRGLPIQAPPSAAVQAQPVSTKTNGVPGSNVPQAGAPDVTAMPVAARPVDACFTIISPLAPSDHLLLQGTYCRCSTYFGVWHSSE